MPVDGIAPDLPISNQSHVLLVSFEPLLDKYALYLTRQKHADESRGTLAIEHPSSPGWSVPGRAIVLPFAVGGPPDGDAEFNIARSDGCSSLLRINASKAGGTFARWGFGMNMCGHAVAKRRVPLVSLQVCPRTFHCLDDPNAVRSGVASLSSISLSFAPRTTDCARRLARRSPHLLHQGGRAGLRRARCTQRGK